MAATAALRRRLPASQANSVAACAATIASPADGRRASESGNDKEREQSPGMCPHADEHQGASVTVLRAEHTRLNNSPSVKQRGSRSNSTCRSDVAAVATATTPHQLNQAQEPARSGAELGVCTACSRRQLVF